jgi:aldehyde dehydrogenase (NAD+)
MTAAAKHLTPVTLELGGKSPCIVDRSADIDYAARRITWGKTINAGQTCIAPDYLFVHHHVKDRLIDAMKNSFNKFFGKDPAESKSYDRIINQKHFDRLQKLLQGTNVIYGGESNEADLYIAPTLIDNVKTSDPIMQEEIFGPLLPILTYQSFDEVVQYINSRPKPLSAYLFSNLELIKDRFLEDISFGGGCINDCIMHIANPYFPFGGVGNSGMGGYHGKYSFETFSHRKSVYTRTHPFDVPISYPPYSPLKLQWLRSLLGI